jgi:hypothetical protein
MDHGSCPNDRPCEMGSVVLGPTFFSSVGPLDDYCRNQVDKLSLGMGSSYSQLGL